MTDTAIPANEAFEVFESEGVKGVIELGERTFVRTFEQLLADEEYEKCAIMRQLEIEWLADRKLNMKKHFDIVSEVVSRDSMLYYSLLIASKSMSNSFKVSQDLNGQLLINGMNFTDYMLALVLKEDYHRIGLADEA